jgi:hypothetical protein
MPETYPLHGLEDLGFVMPQKSRPVVPSLRDAEAPGITSDADVDQQLVSQLTGGNILPDVALPDVPLADICLPEACPQDSIGKKSTSHQVAEEAMIVVFELGLCF